MQTSVQFRRADHPSSKPASGAQAIAGALMAVLGVLAAANPHNLVLRAVNDAAPQLAAAIPTLVTACGAVIAAFSHPPSLGGK